MSNLLDNARRETDVRDLITMALIERLNHEGQRANALAVGAQIKGAPIQEVQRVLERLCFIGVLQPINTHDFVVTQLGSELMSADMEGWMPSSREQRRRDMMSEISIHSTRN